MADTEIYTRAVEEISNRLNRGEVLRRKQIRAIMVNCGIDPTETKPESIVFMTEGEVKMEKVGMYKLFLRPGTNTTETEKQIRVEIGGRRRGKHNKESG